MSSPELITSLDTAVSLVAKSLPPGGEATFKLVKRSPRVVSASSDAEFEKNSKSYKDQNSFSAFGKREEIIEKMGDEREKEGQNYCSYPLVAKYPLLSSTSDLKLEEWTTPISLFHMKKPPPPEEDLTSSDDNNDDMMDDDIADDNAAARRKKKKEQKPRPLILSRKYQKVPPRQFVLQEGSAGNSNIGGVDAKKSAPKRWVGTPEFSSSKYFLINLIPTPPSPSGQYEFVIEVTPIVGWHSFRVDFGEGGLGGGLGTGTTSGFKGAIEKRDAIIKSRSLASNGQNVSKFQSIIGGLEDTHEPKNAAGIAKKKDLSHDAMEDIAFFNKGPARGRDRIRQSIINNAELGVRADEDGVLGGANDELFAVKEFNSHASKTSGNCAMDSLRDVKDLGGVIDDMDMDTNELFDNNDVAGDDLVDNHFDRDIVDIMDAVGDDDELELDGRQEEVQIGGIGSGEEGSDGEGDPSLLVTRKKRGREDEEEEEEEEGGGGAQNNSKKKARLTYNGGPITQQMMVSEAMLHGGQISLNMLLQTFKIYKGKNKEKRKNDADRLADFSKIFKRIFIGKPIIHPVRGNEYRLKPEFAG